ncbi:MAG: AzlD domain-containing protein [Desulfobacteraceae bacterium]|nr:MAG: AzlD domain-containing protein [Desulfobacteraceae bacterium]
MDLFLMVAGMAVVTFLIRYLLLPISDHLRLPSGVQNALAHVPAAVLTAIIVPAVLLPHGKHLQITYANPYLVGALVTGAIGAMSKNLLLTITGGMAGFMLWQWILSTGWL